MIYLANGKYFIVNSRLPWDDAKSDTEVNIIKSKISDDELTENLPSMIVFLV